WVYGNLPSATVGQKLPRPSFKARGHWEPHHRGTQPLHPGGSGLQRDGAPLPDPHHRQGVRFPGEAELHRCQRAADLDRADGELRHHHPWRTGHASAATCGEIADAMIARAHRAGRRVWLAVPFLLALRLSAAAQGPVSGLQPVPPLTARVTDLTGTLTSEQQAALEQKLAAFEAAKGSQLAALVVPTTHPEEIEQYSIRVVDQWKLGRGTVGGKKVDDGALLLVAKDDHRVRIEVGYGLEGVLTDAMSNRIISETIAPAFREGNFYEGIDAGLDQMMKLIEGEPLPPPEHSWQGSEHHWGPSILPELFFAVLIGSVVLRAIFGRTVGAMLTGLG